MILYILIKNSIWKWGIRMKIITLCGSLKFQKEMMIVAEKMALKGNCILTPVFPILENCEKTEEQ